jgi:hypothetical protein
MNLRTVERNLTRGRDRLTSTALVAASLFASVAWLLWYGTGHANRLGTAVVVALPIGGLVHAFWRSIGLAAVLANAFVLVVALIIALLVTMSWPGPAL